MGRCIVVLGTHRTGTSAVAGVLHRLGVNMGPELLGAYPSNPHFEDREFVQLNDDIIGDWKNPITYSITTTQLDSMKKLAEDRRDQLLWGVKDPRLCVTGRWLLPLLDHARIIIVSRAFEDCVGSLMVRDCLTRKGATFVQKLYLEQLDNLLKKCRFPCLRVSYDDLLDYPTAWVNLIAKFVFDEIGAAGTVQIANAVALINPKLRHWRKRKLKSLASIIIPVVNNSDLTGHCIASIREQTTFPIEIILIDNGSEPEESAILKQLGAEAYLKFDELLGFPAACNRGAAVANGDYVVFLNNDTKIETDRWLTKLLTTLERSGAWVVSPVTDFIHNPIQRIEHTKDKIVEVDELYFVCAAMRKETFRELGGLDEAFGAGNCEDVDFSRRVQRAGGRLLVDGEVFIHHEGHQTFKRLFNVDGFGELLAWNRSLLTRKFQPDDFGALAVGIALRNPKDVFFRDWTRMIINGLRPGDTIAEPVIGMPTNIARNMIVRKFLETGRDTLLFIDSDSEYELSAVEKLRSDERTFDCDIVQALITNKSYPPEPIVFREVEGKLERHHDFNIGDVVEVPACGMAFTLIRRWVVEAIPEHWFEFLTSWGEDVLFCAKARGKGARIAVNTAIEIGHVGDHSHRWSNQLGNVP